MPNAVLAIKPETAALVSAVLLVLLEKTRRNIVKV